MNNEIRGGCLPTREQEMLLKAALLEGDDCIGAFDQWKLHAELSNVDPGSYRLFPLLYSNLVRNGVDDPMLNIFKWVYNTALGTNRERFRNISLLVEKFNYVGIPVAALKGTALAAVYYGDYGLRPMLDADLLVPTVRARDAARLLASLGWGPTVTPLKGLSDTRLLSALGWTPRVREVHEYTDDFFTVRHGQDFTAPDRFTVDLHWHVLHGYNPVGSDSDFWEGARGAEIEGVPVLILDPADQLLQVCAHGMRWDPIPPMRWVADAAVIIRTIRKEGQLDWDRLAAAARKHRVILPVRDALGYLRGIIPGLVPEDVLSGLGSAPVTDFERTMHRVRTSPPGIADGLVELGFLWRSYGKENAGKGAAGRIAGFPSFLTHVFGMDNVWQLVLYSGYELVRRTSRLIGPRTKTGSSATRS